MWKIVFIYSTYNKSATYVTVDFEKEKKKAIYQKLNKRIGKEE